MFVIASEGLPSLVVVLLMGMCVCLENTVPCYIDMSECRCSPVGLGDNRVDVFCIHCRFVEKRNGSCSYVILSV